MVTAGPPHHILGALIWAPPAECYDYSATCWVLWLQRHLLSVMITAPPVECFVIQVGPYHRRDGSIGHLMNRITSLDARTASPCAARVASGDVWVMRSMMTIVTRRNTTYARAEGRLVRCVKERMKTAPGTSRKAREQKTHRSSCSAPAAAFK